MAGWPVGGWMCRFPGRGRRGVTNETAKQLRHQKPNNQPSPCRNSNSKLVENRRIFVSNFEMRRHARLNLRTHKNKRVHQMTKSVYSMLCSILLTDWRIDKAQHKPFKVEAELFIVGIFLAVNEHRFIVSDNSPCKGGKFVEMLAFIHLVDLNLRSG